MNDRDFHGKICLVTGGSKGQGRAISHELAGRGAHVIVNWFHDRDAAEETVEAIVSAGGSAEGLRASVAKAESVDAMFAEIGQRHGRLDVLVNNAARGVFEPPEVLTERDWERAIDTNVHGPRRCSRAAFPLMREHGGAIVNLGSIGTSVVIDNYLCPAVCKGALEQLTRYLAVEFGPYGIRVNMASAGMLESRTVELFPDSEKVLEATVAGTPLNRLGTFDENAKLVAFLASDQSSWMTGEEVVNDGGLRLGGALIRAGGTWGGRARVVAPARTEPVTEEAEDDCVAIVGMGMVVPGAESPDEFWNLLRTGTPAFSAPGDRYPEQTFWAASPGERDRTYAGVSGFVRAGRSDDLAPESSLSASWLRRALRQAMPASAARGLRTSCHIGACSDGDQHFEQAMVVEGYARRLAEQWPGDDPVSLDELRAALRTRYDLDRGPAAGHLPDGIVRHAIDGLLPGNTPYTVVDTACSSSLYALDQGMSAVLDGRSELALCGGYFMVTPRFNVLFGKLSGLSKTGKVAAYQRSADGTLFSDGAAVVALRRLSDARRDGDEVLAVVAGFGAAADGRGRAIAAPNARGQGLAVARAGTASRVPAEEIGWIVGHGTGTAAGDAVELSALDEAAPAVPVLCTSNKTLVGHTGWAAGAVSVIHAVLGLRNGVVPAQRPIADEAELLAARRVTVPVRDTPLPASSRTVGVSGFGFGGTNGHLLLRKEPAQGTPVVRSKPEPRYDEPIVLVGWSAQLPGAPDRATVLDRLGAGKPPAEAAAFPSPYPAPPVRVTKMPPAASNAVDRAQLMALEVADRFVTENGLLWRGIEPSTGVIGAHYGPATSWLETALRCYADDLLSWSPPGLSEHDFAMAAEAAVKLVRETTPVTTQDSQPGLMGNVIPARIANHYDLNGPVLLADAGPAATLDAVDIARRYLRDGTLDLALVLAVNGNSTPELETLLGREALGEGAFLFALARRGDAVAAGWPVLCEVSTEAPVMSGREPGIPGRDYLGAHGAIDLLTALATLDETRRREIAGAFPAPTVTLTAPARTKLVRHNDRYVCSLADDLEPADESWTIPPGPDWLVLAQPGCADLVPAAVHEAGAVVRELDSAVPVEEQVSLGEGRFSHVRMVVSTGKTGWPTSANDDLVLAHEALFLAAKACRDRIDDGGSLGVVIDDALAGGVPHPDTGLFSAMVNSLAWDLRGARLAVVIGTADWDEVNRELANYGGNPVVIHRDGKRLRTTIVPSPSDLDDIGPVLRPGAVVVTTGGARGITAACMKELATRQRIRLWLLGSSQLQDVPANILDAPDSRLNSLRGEFIAAERAKRPDLSVRELNARFAKLLNARESLLNLRELRALCGEDAVHYLSCDLTSASAVNAAVQRIRETDPRVDLLVHGAGLHNGGDISRITLDGLRRIRDVKRRGYHNLKEAFGDAQPLSWCNFGSVAGLVGLPGETDYAPGNDFLHGAARTNTFARGLEERTLVWPIWSEVGMGGSDLMQGNNERAGIMAPLQPAEGVRHFVAELTRFPASEPLVAFLNPRERETFSRQFPGFVRNRPARAPWLLGTPYRFDTRSAEWILELGDRTAGFLTEHLVNGKPTLHGTGLATVAAEAATELFPERPVSALRDLRFHAFVAPKARPGSPYRVTAEVTGHEGDKVLVEVRITSDVVDRRGRVLRRDRPHFACVAELGPLAPRPPAAVRVSGKHSDDPYYRQGSGVYLGGVFQATSESVEGPRGSSARWVFVPPATESDRALQENPPVPSVLLDALARTRMLRTDENGVHLLAVPRAIGRIDFFTTGGDGPVSRANPDGIVLNHVAAENVDEASTMDGRVLIRITGCEIYDVDDTETRL
ncbi:fatty-acid synthase [Amycolatopsis orientalis]|uniref:Fatty-acid synthase n=1 Tax=Amycolatopsis orientalis TaxID=31958 RepID=A0A193BUX8_AMYOR|nr:SDR family oxidoreductase [Amycolatopsis orientalis]ANN15988.1 fatty-acid synthase [Amycolatopsis orientalis]